MSHRRPSRSRARVRPRRPSRPRRLARAVTALVGAVVAAGSAWIFGGVRPTAADRPPAPVVASRPASLPPGLRLGAGPVADPTVTGGRLELPVVDFTEVLPGCHK